MLSARLSGTSGGVRLCVRQLGFWVRVVGLMVAIPSVCAARVLISIAF